MAELSEPRPPLPPGLWRVMLGTALVVLSYSLLNPVLAVRLQMAGASSTAVGAFAMLAFVSVAALVPVVPWVFARVGVGRAYRIGLLLEVLASLGYLITDQYGWWCAFNLMAGVGAAAAWNATEALIAHNVAPSHRGRLTGLYQTLLGGAMALGPMLPGLLALGPTQANVLASVGLGGGLLLALAPVVLTLQASHEDQARMSLWQAVRFRPALVCGAIVGGVYEVGLSSVTTAYGAQMGLSLAAATSIAGALGLGSFVLQYPVGWLADHLPLKRLFMVGAVLLLLSALAFSQIGQWPWMMWWCAAVWGSVGGALYTLSMIAVAHDFADTSSLAGTSAMIAGYTAGGALGPLISGAMLDHWGVQGQALWLGGLALSLLMLQWRPARAVASAH
jgi:MFS family permease